MSSYGRSGAPLGPKDNSSPPGEHQVYLLAFKHLLNGKKKLEGIFPPLFSPHISHHSDEYRFSNVTRITICGFPRSCRD